MHDIKAIRADPIAFDAGLARRNEPPQAAAVLTIDTQLRAVQTETQKDLAWRGELSKRIGVAARSGEPVPEALAIEVAQVKARIAEAEEAGRALEAARTQALLAVPNLAADDVPDGSDESANVFVHERGTKPMFDFPPQEHDAIAARLGYDPDAASAIAGARFAVLKGPLARLHRALGQWMLDVQTRDHGYTEAWVPLLVRDAAMIGTGQLPKFEADSFAAVAGHLTNAADENEINKLIKFDAQAALAARMRSLHRDRRWLIPTAEVSLTNLVRESILSETDLPLRFAALTPCFRQEAGSAGKDTRGLIRQHQFDKVELVAIVCPQDSAAEHERLTAHAEAILDQLHLPYRRMLLCAGDMGFSARKTFDLEVWLPGQNRYREISSCSNCGDFQARRMDARFRPAGGKGTEFVHTLNGSGLAVGRALVAVLENYQRADGSVAVPEVLRPYMSGTDALKP